MEVIHTGLFPYKITILEKILEKRVPILAFFQSARVTLSRFLKSTRKFTALIVVLKVH